MSSPSDEKIDQKKRNFLVKATTTIGGIGVVAATLPFVTSMLPSSETQAAGAPIKVDLSDLKPGEQKTVVWRGRPVWLIRRTKEMLATLALDEELLRDPDSLVDQQPRYARNQYRARRPDILVLIGLCTHLGCSPTFRPDPGGVQANWLGGFYCSCHGSKFDLAGRVYKGVPAPINLEVPPYVFLSENEILVGADSAQET